MNSQTKILVIHMKELIIGLIVAAALIILTILAIACFSGKSGKAGSSGGSTVSKNTQTQSSSAPARNNPSPSSNTYMPGVYTSSISVNGTPLEIQVTVDETNINAIELKNLSDSITTMYPLMQTSFDELAAQVIKNGSTINISYEAENKYTSTLLLDGIQQALDKCVKQ
ncbi:MAG: hypothetical protein Q4F11_08475 [Eubacteriales bacterium]|nr:hypothetical protein [Eubacteriales bacterium]